MVSVAEFGFDRALVKLENGFLMDQQGFLEKKRFFCRLPEFLFFKKGRKRVIFLKADGLFFKF